MQLRHVTSDLGQGLRRNLSMHLAVVLTLFISLSLGGVGVMLGKQAQLTADVLGNELQIRAYLCVDDDPFNRACAGEVTEAQVDNIRSIIEDNPEVEGDPTFESKQEGYDQAEELAEGEGGLGPVTVDQWPRTVFITLEDPDQDQGILSALRGLEGVSHVTSARQLVGPVFALIDLLRYSAWGAAAVLIVAAVLLTANTIRLTALARRKEIEIMRLVGASRLSILLPFVLEALAVAAIGVALAGGALAAFTKYVLIDGLDERVQVLPFIGWPEFGQTLILVAIAGPVLTILPTLLMTRKYLRV